ncbi:hypothetical protein BU17DRAFT_73260 [Hysterangium stoloniferum]|nr:hypothetical protein BU17DRAFT_73260 [Hysterangium stoloniferum]
MKYVALLSGGKDSCYNLLHCAQNGHQLVAAASLGPGPGKDEIDSYLYQTVGQDAIQLIADALEVPLLRRVITGEAVNQDSEYGSRLSLDPDGVRGDETEDLLALLLEVKFQFPEIQGVSVGAILSNYQRVRIEHVCQRLSLTPLCYLWQRDQSELLGEMIDSGMDAILIKVAGIGLTTRHLGTTLAEMQPILMKLNDLYGAHVCGEGGEYESFTLDCPMFKSRIILDDTEIVIHSDSDFATVAYLRVKQAHLEKKLSDSSVMKVVSSPPTFGDQDYRVRDAVLRTRPDDLPIVLMSAPDAYELWKNKEIYTPCTNKCGSWVVAKGVGAVVGSNESIEDEVKRCFESIREQLAVYSLNISDIANVTLLLSSMDFFPAINLVYSSFFGSSPPARACVATDLPSPYRLQMECIACASCHSFDRRALHVQSLSYWAPANIGPYSQAITVGRRIFVSGQIGLLPSSHSLPSPPSLSQELALSMRHIRTIIDSIETTTENCRDSVIQGVFSWFTQAQDLPAIQEGMEASCTFGKGAAVTLFIMIKSLPKLALVETQVLLHTGREELSEDDERPRRCISQFESGSLPGLEAQWEVSRFDDLDAFMIVVGCMNDDDVITSKTLASHYFDTPLSHPISKP